MISKEAGISFELKCDGQTSHSDHFLGLFALFVHRGKRCQRLLSLSQMGEELIVTAHVEHIERGFGVTKK